MDTKAEEEVVSGELLLTVGGRSVAVPELRWRANREWQSAMQAKFVELAGLEVDSLEGVRAMGDAQRDIIRAYVGDALGDLEDATESETDAIYNRLIEVSFPQASSRTMLLMALVRQANESAQASSTSGPSPAGASAAPTMLRDHSPSARSSSSTRRRRSA